MRRTPTKKRKVNRKKKNNAAAALTTTTTTADKSLPLDRHEQITKLLPFLISTVTSIHSFLRRNDLHLTPQHSLSIESLLASTAHSITNLVSTLKLPFQPAAEHRMQLDSDCWFQRFLSSDSDLRWIECFNFGKESFELLLRCITPSVAHLNPIPPNYALASTLFRLAHGASYSAVARRFGFESSAAACKAFFAVCKAINGKVGHLFEFKTDYVRVNSEFRWLALPNCCGIVGLEKFEVCGDQSLIVQAVVDSEGRFLDVSAGWPCTMSPGIILRQSKLFCCVEESGEYLTGPHLGLNNCKTIRQYVLGDSCFPLLPWLYTPYTKPTDEEDFTPPEAAFNAVHSRAMRLVEKAFLMLKTRWRILDNWKGQSTEAFPFVLMMCCLLHNFLIKCSEPLPDVDVPNSRSQEFPACEDELDETGKEFRDALASYMLLTDRLKCNRGCTYSFS